MRKPRGSEDQFRMLAWIGILLIALSSPVFAQGKNPLILIPGLSGTELKDKVTGERVWFRTFKSKSDDLRLPISLSMEANHDDLAPGDVIRLVKLGIFPSVDVYDGFIRTMELRAGYHEESWDTPSESGFEDALYVFPYDWRLDNVENARRLVRQIGALRVKLKRPDLKFDVVAHSMGGIISRYAAMYGDTELPAGEQKPVPTWAGAQLFDKMILMATPNEGSAMSLDNLLNGFSIGGWRIDLPFVQDTSKFTVFTIPAAYQLLPAPGTIRVFDDRLKPLAIDIYDPAVWSKYGWGVLGDKKLDAEFTATERKAAPAYFEMELDRARRLHEALTAAAGKTGGIKFYVLGSDCRTTLDAVVISGDKDGKHWKTYFRPKAFVRADGTRVTEDDLKKVMSVQGDGVVSRRSLEGTTEASNAGVESVLGVGQIKLICSEHNTLAANAAVQEYVIGVLTGK